MSMLESLSRVPEVERHDKRYFDEVVTPAYKPVVFRGLVKDWPLIGAADRSASALMDYLKERSNPGRIKILEAPASTRGFLFYREELDGFNFERKVTTFNRYADRLLGYMGRYPAPVLSLQSAYVDEYFSDVHVENTMHLLGNSVRPRIWIGNSTVVGTHHDDAENIACVAAGRRRFTLFPPDQVANLYIGPIDNTPAGAPVSMASLLDPDFDRFPNLKVALEHAYVAELEPGDAIYIPTLWWHHVEALSDINVLVNYWQGGSIGGATGPMPLDSMLLSLLTIKSRPDAVRKAWKSLFDHYVFEANGDPVAHLPMDKRGVLGERSEAQDQQIKRWLIKQLSAD